MVADAGGVGGEVGAVSAGGVEHLQENLPDANLDPTEVAGIVFFALDAAFEAASVGPLKVEVPGEDEV